MTRVLRLFGSFAMLLLVISLVPTSTVVLMQAEDITTEPSVETGTRSRQEFTHTVFAEDMTGTWCPYCPSASETLKDIYNTGDYQFYFVCLIEDVNDEHGQASTLHQLGRVAEERGQLDEAEAFYLKAEAIYKHMDDPYLLDMARRSLERVRSKE